MQEVVFLADFRCVRCQKRVAEVMAKMNGENETLYLFSASADLSCVIMSLVLPFSLHQ